MSGARCLRCGAAATHQPCCSTHGKPLCCKDYRWTHFVEVRPCCATDRAVMAQEATP